VQIARDLDVLRNELRTLRENAGTIGLVPTMGALHRGHVELVRRARQAADAVVVSIFVNPTQFGPNEDLDAYPRQFERDSELLAGEGCALLWAPDAATMYPDGFATTVSVGGIGETLCGAARPGHFDGVATVVAKLFNQVQPDMAFFGEKDFQQLAVIRRMARDLDLTHPAVGKIIGIETVREKDGLAMSSRNAYLSHTEREAAATLPRAMREAIARIEDGQEVAPTLAMLEDELLGAGFSQVDYAAVVDAGSLSPVDGPFDKPARLLVAARIGGTRLIDNMPLNN